MNLEFSKRTSKNTCHIYEKRIKNFLYMLMNEAVITCRRFVLPAKLRYMYSLFFGAPVSFEVIFEISTFLDFIPSVSL